MTFFRSDDALEEWAGRYGTPLFVYDSEEIEAAYRTLRDTLGDYVDILYSLKANPNLTVTRFIGLLGGGADVSSGFELEYALRSGINPENILFTGPGKKHCDLERAIEMGIAAIAAESWHEMRAIDEIAGRLGRTCSVILRLNPRLEADGIDSPMCGRPTQFGFDVPTLLERPLPRRDLRSRRSAARGSRPGRRRPPAVPTDDAPARWRRVMVCTHARELDRASPVAFSRALQDSGVNLAFTQVKNELAEELAASIRPGYQLWFHGRDLCRLPDAVEASFADLGPSRTSLLIRLRDQVVDHARFFAEVSGDERPFVSLRVVSAEYFQDDEPSVSREFHRDAATLTLFRAFAGDGPEWLENDAVRRRAFEEDSIQQLDRPQRWYVRGSGSIHRTSSSTLGILKGELDPDHIDERCLEFVTSFIERDEIPRYNVGKSLIHRGPPLAAGSRRLLLTVTSVRAPS